MCYGYGYECTTKTDSVSVFGWISAIFAEIRFCRNGKTSFSFGRNILSVSVAHRNVKDQDLGLGEQFFPKLVVSTKLEVLNVWTIGWCDRSKKIDTIVEGCFWVILSSH